MSLHFSEMRREANGWERIAVRAFVFSCFFPYPALAIGGNTGLQISHAIALASVPYLATRSPGRAFLALLLILTPVYLSMFLNLMIGSTPEVSVLPKESIALTLALLVLWPAEWACRRALFGDVLGAARAAIVVHSLIGLYQVYAFASNEFPLLFLYRNPSFKSMQEWHAVYAMFIKRPCGLFPEPSAMAASLGPWLVLLTGLSLEPSRTAGVERRGRWLAPIALVGGFTLLALSRSGATLPIAATAIAVGLARRGSDATRNGFGRIAKLALVLAGVIAVGGYAVAKISQGFDARLESSWNLRGLSIQTGLTANTDPRTLAIGVGPGQSTPIVRRQLAYLSLPEDQDDLAIFSLTVCYYMETGFVGGLAILIVLALAVETIFRSSAVGLGLGALGAWLVGVTVTTSYMPMSAIWLFLGAMLSWDRLFPPLTADGAEVFA